MSTTVDSLSIEISAQATKASQALKGLNQRLLNISSSLTKSGSNLSIMANGVGRLASAMNSMNSIKTADFTRLTANLDKLSKIDSSAINSAAVSISRLTGAFNTLGAVPQSALQVGGLASNLSKLGNKGVTNAITNLPALASGLNNLMTTLSKAPTVSNNLIQMTNALANLASQGKKIGSASNSIVSGLNKFGNAATKAGKKSFSLSSIIGKLYANFFWVKNGIQQLWKSIEGTSDYIESFNYFNVAFEKIASDWKADWEKYGYDNAEAYADSFVERMNETLGKMSGVQVSIGSDGKGLLQATDVKNLGLNIQEVTQYASQLASVTNSVGLTGEATLAATQSFTALAGDISSLFNIDYSSVSKNIQSGLIGQSRALYKYGIDITNATLQTYAYDLGLKKAVSEMTQAEKMQLRMIAILDQSKVSWGDLANTINSPNNMIRQFKNNLSELSDIFGQLFIPLLEKVMPLANGITIAFKTLLTDIAGFFGIKIDFNEFGEGYNEIEDNMEGIEDSLDGVTDAAKKAKGSLAGFDELNNISTGSSSGTGSGASEIDLTNEIIAATKKYQDAWADAYAKMENRAQAFADKISKALEPVKSLFSNISIGDWNAAGQDVSNMAVGLFNFFSDAIKEVNWEEIGNNIGEFIKGINWTETLKSVGDLIYGAIEAALETWEGAFNAAPIETSIITAIGLLKWTGLGGAIFNSMAASLSTETIPLILFSPVGVHIGSSILESIGSYLRENMGPNIYDALNYGLSGALLGGVIGAIAGGPIGALIGVVAGALIGELVLAFENNSEKIKKWFGELPNKLINSLFNFDVSLGLFEYAGEFFEKANTAFEEKDWWEFGKDILLGILSGIGGALSFIVEPITDLFDSIVKAICDVFGIHSPAEEMKPFGENIFSGIVEGFKSTFSEWTNIVKTFFDDEVKPWFTKERWVENIGSIKSALSSKWNEAKEWWNNNKPNLSAIDTKIKMPHLQVTWDTDGWAAKALQKLGLKGFPNFAVSYYAQGGFPEDGWFRANHGEIMGRFDNGQSVVANNMQITEGIADAVYRGNQESNALLRQEVQILREQTEILMQLLEKETGISERSLFNSVRNSARDYTGRTGKPAFDF